MHNILAIVCSKRVTAPCSMFVCSDCIGNLAGRVNSASNTGFVYKHVKYLIGTLCNVEAKKRGMSNENLASHANRNALYAQVERDLAEQGTWLAMEERFYRQDLQHTHRAHNIQIPHISPVARCVLSLTNIQQRLAHSHKEQRRYCRATIELCQAYSTSYYIVATPAQSCH